MICCTDVRCGQIAFLILRTSGINNDNLLFQDSVSEAGLESWADNTDHHKNTHGTLSYYGLSVNNLDFFFACLFGFFVKGC